MIQRGESHPALGAFQTMRLKEVLEEEGIQFLTVDILADKASVPCRFRVDAKTAAQLRQVLSFRPFAERGGESHTYWHQGSYVDPAGDTKYRVRVCLDSLCQLVYIPCTDKFLRDIRWLQRIESSAELESLRYEV